MRRWANGWQKVPRLRAIEIGNSKPPYKYTNTSTGGEFQTKIACDARGLAFYAFLCGLQIKTAYIAVSRLYSKAGVPNRIRTGVTAVKGQCPRPLDDGDSHVLLQCFLLLKIAT